MSPPSQHTDETIRDEDLRRRVREIIAEPQPRSRLSKCLSHSLTAVVIGFGLTTAGGAWIAAQYQERSETQKRDAEVREARRTAAMQTFEDIGRLMDRRLFWSSQLYDATRTDQSDTAPARRRRLLEKYGVARDAWRESFLTNAAAVCRYFGADAGRVFADTISGLFSRFGRAATELAAEADQNPRAVLGHDESYPLYDSLRGRIFRFNLEVVDMIRRDSLLGGVRSDECKSIAPYDPLRVAP